MKRKNKFRKTEQQMFEDANDLTKIETKKLEELLKRFETSLVRVTTGDLSDPITKSNFPTFLMINISKMKAELASRIGKK